MFSLSFFVFSATYLNFGECIFLFYFNSIYFAILLNYYVLIIIVSPHLPNLATVTMFATSNLMDGC